jgi:hypothetical protein
MKILSLFPEINKVNIDLRFCMVNNNEKLRSQWAQLDVTPSYDHVKGIHTARIKGSFDKTKTQKKRIKEGFLDRTLVTRTSSNVFNSVSLILFSL